MWKNILWMVFFLALFVKYFISTNLYFYILIWSKCLFCICKLEDFLQVPLAQVSVNAAKYHFELRERNRRWNLNLNVKERHLHQIKIWRYKFEKNVTYITSKSFIIIVKEHVCMLPNRISWHTRVAQFDLYHFWC